MKQIKTIMVKMRDVDDLNEFDEKVNAAMAEGWALVKRDVLRPYEGQTRIFHRMLYAELERRIVEQVPHDCQTCAHVDTNPLVKPCCNCSDGENWEPGT